MQAFKVSIHEESVDVFIFFFPSLSVSQAFSIDQS